MKTLDPFPSLSHTTPEMPERSPLEPRGQFGKRRKKFRADNAKWAGQRRAIEKLEIEPKRISTGLPQGVEED